MKISYQYLTTDELDVSIKDIFDYIKFLHTDSDMSIKSPLSYVEEWELNKEEIIQALYGTQVYEEVCGVCRGKFLSFQNNVKERNVQLVETTEHALKTVSKR